MKTKEELNANKEEMESLDKKLSELTEEELNAVAGGIDAGDGETGTPIDEDEVSETSLGRFRRPTDYDTVVQERRKREQYKKPTVKRVSRPGRIRNRKEIS